MDIKKAVQQVLLGHDLKIDEMRKVMTQIMSGKATDAQIGGFLVGLRIKGETVDEIIGAAQIMRELSLTLKIDSQNLVDIVGTGGDEASIFNVSTASILNMLLKSQQSFCKSIRLLLLSKAKPTLKLMSLKSS